MNEARPAQTYKERKNSVILKIKEDIEKNLVGIIENCIQNSDEKRDGEKNRHGLLTQRTEASRRRYVISVRHMEDVMKGAIRNIKFLEQGQCVSKEQEHYANELRKELVNTVFNLIFKERWEKDSKISPEEWDSSVFESWSFALQELMGKGAWSKILNLRELYNCINRSLFYNYQIAQRNSYWLYFQKPNYVFLAEETAHEYKKELGETSGELRTNRPSADIFSHISGKLDNRGYRVDWILFFYEQAQIQYNEAEKWYKNEVEEYKGGKEQNQELTEQENSKKNEDAYKEIVINFYIENYCSPYTEYPLDDVEAKHRHDDDYFQKFLDAFMISVVAKQFGCSGAYLWGSLQWFKGVFKYDEKSKSFLTRRWVDMIIYSKDVMKQRILFSLMERLTEDVITLSEQDKPTTSTELKYFYYSGQAISPDVANLLKNMKELHFAVRKKEEWSVYNYEKSCIEKLLQCANDSTTRSYALFLKEKSSVQGTQSFQSIKNHFFDEEEMETTDVVYAYCLNQFFFLDSALELVYGISKITEIKADTYKYLRTQITELAEVLIKLQHNLKCGVGKIIYGYFEKVSEKEKRRKLNKEEVCEWLKKLKEAIDQDLLSYNVGWIDDCFYKNVQQIGWEDLIENLPAQEKSICNQQLIAMVRKRSETDWEFVCQYEEAAEKRKQYVKILCGIIQRDKFGGKIDNGILYIGTKEKIQKKIEKYEKAGEQESGDATENMGCDLFTVTFEWAVCEWENAYHYASEEPNKKETLRIKEFIRTQILAPIDEMVTREYGNGENNIYKTFLLEEVKNAVYYNILGSCNEIRHEKCGTDLKKRIQDMIVRNVYDSNLSRIERSLGEKNNTFWDNLMISNDARSFAEEYLLSSGGGFKERGRTTNLYGVIQNALINANYRYNNSKKKNDL